MWGTLAKAYLLYLINHSTPIHKIVKYGHNFKKKKI